MDLLQRYHRAIKFWYRYIPICTCTNYNNPIGWLHPFGPNTLPLVRCWFQSSRLSYFQCIVVLFRISRAEFHSCFCHTKAISALRDQEQEEKRKFPSFKKKKKKSPTIFQILPSVPLAFVSANESNMCDALGLGTKAALTHHVVEALWCKLSWHFLDRFFEHCEGLLWMKRVEKKVGGGGVCLRQRLARETGVRVTSHSSTAAVGAPHNVNAQRGIGGRWEAGSYLFE